MLFWKVLLVLYGLKAVMYYILLYRRSRTKPGCHPHNGAKALSVDIILPMYNEEKVILATLSNLLKIQHDAFTILVVDDGSTDQSSAIVSKHFGQHPRVRLLHQQNAGKSAALNRGLHASGSDIVVCIDADTQVRPDVITKLLPYFADTRVAAVSGFVKAGNRINLLTDTQYLEYLTIQNHERIVFDTINGILVVPGALGAFRRSAVMAMGGYTTEALAEDCDITLRMLCSGYIIRNAPEAFSFTEVPDTLPMYLRQRVRWTVGLVQGLLRHQRRLIAQPNKLLAWIVIPYTWIYRLLLPLLIPIGEYVLIGSLFFHWDGPWTWYLLYILSELMINCIILLRVRERFNPIWLALLQRVFRHLAFFVYINVFFRWLNGNLYGWSKIARQGSVKSD